MNYNVIPTIWPIVILLKDHLQFHPCPSSQLYITNANQQIGLHLLCIHTLHYITLHYITLHYITLHYITLHYITYLNTYIHIYTYIHTYIHIYIYISSPMYHLIFPSSSPPGRGDAEALRGAAAHSDPVAAAPRGDQRRRSSDAEDRRGRCGVFGAVGFSPQKNHGETHNKRGKSQKNMRESWSGRMRDRSGFSKSFRRFWILPKKKENMREYWENRRIAKSVGDGEVWEVEGFWPKFGKNRRILGLLLVNDG